jgi:CheY-like chemotaxis protein
MRDDAGTPRDDALDQALDDTETAVGQALENVFDHRAGLEQIKHRMRGAPTSASAPSPGPHSAPAERSEAGMARPERPTFPSRASVQKAKILLVDDRPENLLALEAILSALDQTLVRASSGEEALKLLLTDDFAVILLDVQMPGMDGYETASHIKRRERTRDIPIIFLTAINHGPHHTFRGYAAGAVDYISKPFDPWVLRAKVSVFVELYTKNVQLREQAALLRLQLEGGGVAAGSSRTGTGAGVLAELSTRLAAVEEDAEALAKQLDGESADALAVATAAHLERKLLRLRRALEALEPGSAGDPDGVEMQKRW